MQIISKQYTDLNIGYQIEKIAPLSDILFIDIETTGFSAASSVCYLIGCAYYDGIHFTCRQFFADKPVEEKDILKEFLTFASRFKVLIHFNGNNFDIPYLQDKSRKYGLEFTLAGMSGVDLYRRTAPYKNFLKVPNCKQKTLEQYIGINREDTCNGGELINVYQQYVQLFNVDALAKLLLHNENDIQGMIQLIPILAYSDIFNDKLTVTKVNMDRSMDFEGRETIELIMKIVLPSSLPGSITCMSSGCFFKGQGTEGVLKVPVYEDTLKYFYANYRDYYYLPIEDEALHKSVAGFVDKEHRVQATAATCYTKVHSLFLRQWSNQFSPFFKTDYSSKELFLELNSERKKDREFFSQYASHVLGIMAY